MQTFKTKIDGKPFEVNDSLSGYALHHTPASTYVDFFGLNPAEQTFFMQFKHGAAFIYKDMPAEVQQAALAAPSIGKFFHAEIKAKYEADEIEKLSIAPDSEESHFADFEEGDDDDLDDEY